MNEIRKHKYRKQQIPTYSVNEKKKKEKNVKFIVVMKRKKNLF